MRENKFSSTKDIVKMAEFVLKSNYFQFNSKGDFLRAQQNVPLVWFRYIAVFSTQTH